MRDLETTNHRSDRQSGFTLIELMISIVLMALMLGVLGTGLRTIANGWNRYSDHMSDQDMLLRAADLLRRDVSVMQRITWLSGDGSSDISGGGPGPDSNFIFRGTSNQLQFVAIEPPFPTRSGAYVLSYTIAGTKVARLRRARARFHQKMRSLTEIEFKEHVPLLEGAYRMRFMYGHKAPDPAGAVGPWKWVSNWPYTDRMPELIKLEIREARTGKLATPPLIARPKIDAEMACSTDRDETAGCTIRLARNGIPERSEAARK